MSDLGNGVDPGDGDDRFDRLVAEGMAAPVDGWDFDWLTGRATEERPPWGYLRLMGGRMAVARAALDVQTGGGEVLAEVPRRPARLVATEGWPPNAEIAHRRLGPLGVTVVQVGDTDGLPFRTGSFDLVVSRHPTVTVWDEIARVLTPGGTYLSQQVGAGSVGEVAEALVGPGPTGLAREPRAAVAAAEAAGLDVVQLREARLRTVFHDVAAVVWFLRKVVWMVPDFTVARYRPQLVALHERIERDGCFVAHARRFLVEARKPR